MRYGAQRSSLSSAASAAATIGSSCALVPMASRSESIASSTFEVPVKAGPSPSLTPSTPHRGPRKPAPPHAPARPQKTVPPPRAELGKPQAIELAQPFDLAPEFRLGAGVEHVEF